MRPLSSEPDRSIEVESNYDRDACVITAIQEGLPLVPRPYAEIGTRLGMSEDEVLARIKRMKASGTIKRFGVVVRHHELGYRANAMIVWNVPDNRVAELGRRIAGYEFVTLCYRRARHLPDWPYNLYCMIHGRDRTTVLNKIDFLIEACAMHDIAHAVLFSTRRFKQCGARYRARTESEPAQPLLRAAGA
jgi:DNA-binding Lrp family transcriptional regulator